MIQKTKVVFGVSPQVWLKAVTMALSGYFFSLTFFAPPACAGFLTKQARNVLMRQAISYVFHEYILSSITGKRVLASNAIQDSISGKSVSFQGESSLHQGLVVSTWEQSRQQSFDSGLVAEIHWDDRVVSRMLFLSNSSRIVRVWVNSVEYSGKWFYDESHSLYVVMDAGAIYSFN